VRLRGWEEGWAFGSRTVEQRAAARGSILRRIQRLSSAVAADVVCGLEDNILVEHGRRSEQMIFKI